MKTMGETDRQVAMEVLVSAGLSIEELDILFAGLTIPTYFRQSDLSLYGVSVDLEQCLSQIWENVAEIDGTELLPDALSDFGIYGSMLLVYRSEEPAGVYTVPQEARDTAVDMNAAKEMTFQLVLLHHYTVDTKKAS